jgi:hypothetical protein
LRVRVISLQQQQSTKFAPNTKKDTTITKKKCPICSSVFYNTHRLSIHIYKHHKKLLGSAHQPPTKEAKRLNEKQLQKLNKLGTATTTTTEDDDEEEGGEENETDETEEEMEGSGGDEAMGDDEEVDENDLDETGTTLENESGMSEKSGGSVTRRGRLGARRSSRSMSQRTQNSGSTSCYPDDLVSIGNLSQPYVNNEAKCGGGGGGGGGTSKLNSTF